MEDDWVAKRDRRDNARLMKYAIWLCALTGLMQTAALYRISQLPPSDIGISVTLDDTTYTFPDGRILIVDRQTGFTTERLSDGTVKVGSTIVRPPH